jgi:nitrite reductase/ring-hydroxylating ferredoxin subunit
MCPSWRPGYGRTGEAVSGLRSICRSDELVDGGKGVRFVVRRYGVDEPAFAVRHDGSVRAYLNRCAHVPTELDWNAGEFFDHEGRYLVCATHGALYSADSGRCIAGRCNGKGLTALAVVESDGQVFLMES